MWFNLGRVDKERRSRVPHTTLKRPHKSWAIPSTKMKTEERWQTQKSPSHWWQWVAGEDLLHWTCPPLEVPVKDVAASVPHWIIQSSLKIFLSWHQAQWKLGYVEAFPQGERQQHSGHPAPSLLSQAPSRANLQPLEIRLSRAPPRC